MRKGEIKYLLQNKKYIIAEIKDLQLQIDDLNGSESVSISGVSYEERIKSSSISNATEKQAIENLLKVQTLELEKKSLETSIKRIDNGMDALEEREREILIMKYVEHNKFTYTSRKMNTNEESCKTIARRAIDKMSLIIKN